VLRGGLPASAAKIDRSGSRWYARNVRRFAIGLALVAASGARAADNDLQLFRLGHPNDIRICTVCDGTDTVVEPGDLGAQRRFARLSATLGLAFTPPFQEQARTTGQAGFELGVSGAVAFPKLAPNEWPTEGTLGTSAAQQQLVLPTLAIRKGLGGGFELGAAASYLVSSQMVGLSAELRWAVLEGLGRAPDLSLRVFGTRVIGTRELDLVVGGADIAISKSFGIAASAELQPYAQYGVTFVNAESSVVDFHPSTENVRAPTDDDSVFRSISFFDNRYQHAVLGLRVVSGKFLAAVEGGVALGTNPIQRAAVSGGVPEQFTRLWSAAGRLGVTF
jgi:hypothetical protein